LLRLSTHAAGVRRERREEEERRLGAPEPVEQVVDVGEIHLSHERAALLPALGLVRVADDHPHLASAVQQRLGDHRPHVPGRSGDDVLRHENLLGEPYTPLRGTRTTLLGEPRATCSYARAASSSGWRSREGCGRSRPDSNSGRSGSRILAPASLTSATTRAPSALARSVTARPMAPAAPETAGPCAVMRSALMDARHATVAAGAEAGRAGVFCRGVFP